MAKCQLKPFKQIQVLAQAPTQAPTQALMGGEASRLGVYACAAVLLAEAGRVAPI